LVLIFLTVTLVYFGVISSVFAEDHGRIRADHTEQPAELLE
jgi:hypothetical protein